MYPRAETRPKPLTSPPKATPVVGRRSSSASRNGAPSSSSSPTSSLPASTPSTATLVSQLQADLSDVIAKAAVDAPQLCARLNGVNALAVEVVTRWRRSTALALSNIKSYEDLISQKNAELEALTQQLAGRVRVFPYFSSPTRCDPSLLPCRILK